MSKKRKKKQRNYWKIAFISLFIFFFIFPFLWSLTIPDDYNYTENNIETQTIQPKQGQTKIQILEEIVQNYYKTHTYSKIDLFVCTDTSIDIWNLVKTEGINAQICAGNIERNLTKSENILNEMNHAWVLAETNPFAWSALETTGGFLVWDNELYYKGYCFDNPAEFKQFLSLRDDYFEICGEADILIDYWNENYIGKILTADDYEFKGRVDTKIDECTAITNELNGLLI